MCQTVSWCDLEDRFWKNGNPKPQCSLHYLRGSSAGNALRRPWLYYKKERMDTGKLECEHCKIDLIKEHPNVDAQVLSAVMDVDHINSKLKGTLEGEHPDNYQLLCKTCHAIKSHQEGDFNGWKNR